MVGIRQFKFPSSITRNTKGREKLNIKKGTSLLFRYRSAREKTPNRTVNKCLESRNWG